MLQAETPVDQMIFERFRRLQDKGRLAHAYLFIGAEGIGKKETALAAARLFLNDSKMSLENHPDVHVLDNGAGELIKIEQIRDMMAHIALRPYMADKKIFIICRSENLTLESANALLKTLEEPTKDSLIILTTSSEEKILATIRSRCHMIIFSPTPQDDLAEQLVMKYGENPVRAHYYAYASNGCWGRVNALREEKVFEQKNQLLDQFIFQSDIGDLVKELSADKARLRMFLDILLSWIRDVILVKSNCDERRLIHLDRAADLRKFERDFTLEALSDVFNEIAQTKKMAADNFNAKVPLLLIKEKMRWGN